MIRLATQTLPVGFALARTTSSSAVPVSTALVLSAAFLLAVPTLLNGVVILYPDSATYLAQGQVAIASLVGTDAPAMPPTAMTVAGEGRVVPPLDAAPPVIVGGRSIFYSVFAYGAYVATGGWIVVAVQALAIALPLVLLALRFVGPSRAALVLPFAAALSVFTPAGLFVGLLMPDVWSAAMVLSLAAVAAGAARRRATMAALAGIVAFAAMAHASHLLLLGVMLVLLIGAHALGARTHRRPMALAAIGVLCGLAGQALFAAAVERTYGSAPISRPHLTAHLIDMGPGMRTIERSCGAEGGGAGSDLAVCAYTDRLPQPWVPFLFDARGGVFEAVGPEAKRALAADDLRFAMLTLRYAPAATVAGTVRDALSQLWHVSVRDVPTTKRRPEVWRTRFPSDLVQRTERSPLYSTDWGVKVLTRLTQASASLAVLAFTLGASRLPPCWVRENAPLATAMLLLLTGVLLNALICGALASPYGRFQARMTWLLPVAAALLWGALVPRPPLIASRKDAAL